MEIRPYQPTGLESIVRTGRSLFERPAGPTRKFDRLRKAGVLIVGAFMIGSIIYITSVRTQSAFRLHERGGSAVFVDKYVDKALGDEIADGISGTVAGFLGRLGADPGSASVPAAYFITDRHYGVLNAGDPLIRKRLADRPSSDFSLFRTISVNLYANELVADSVASRDGAYVFLLANERWRESALHAASHALAARAMPAQIAAVFNSDASFSAPTWFAYRFVDETVALLVADLYARAGDSGDLDAALAELAERGADRYRVDAGELVDKETEVWYATYNPPSKSVEFYAAAHGFAAFLYRSIGRDGLFTLARNFLGGDYLTLDELFPSWGGLEGALRAWSGSTATPR